MDKAELIRKLYDKGAVKQGSFTLKNGIVVPVQIVLQQIIAYPQLLQAVAGLVWEKVSHVAAGIDLLCGITDTTLPIANCLSAQVGKRALMVRKGNKAYGRKWVEGAYHLGESCLLIEDAVTTGNSILTTISNMKAAGLSVPYVVAFLERDEGGRSALNKIDCEFYSVFTQAELLETLKEVEIPV